MESFYDDLKKLREENNIDLAEIHNRTKIDIKYLEAIEEGNLEILPRTYMRLFLRAYVTEIGGETKDALNQLDHHLSLLEGIEIPETAAAPEEPDYTGGSPVIPVSSKPPKKMRSDYLKGGILIVIVLFAIFIIKQISSDQSVAVGGPATLRVDESIDPITTENLIFNYTRAVEWNETFAAEPPYILQLNSVKNIWYQMIVDNADTLSGVLVRDRDLTWEFTNRFDLRTNSAQGVTVQINGVAVQNLGTHPHPVELIFETDPNRVNIIHYSPNQ